MKVTQRTRRRTRVSKCALVATALLLTFLLSGCKDIHEAIHPTNDSAPRSASPAPAGISSSASVVKVRAADVSIPAGGNTDATVTLSISPGYHINANPATFPYLIATEVSQPGNLEGLPVMGKPIYPAGVTKKFVFAERPLAVYEGDVTIKLPIHLDSKAKPDVHVTKGAHISIPVTVRVQACDSEKCYAPDTLKTTIAVDVK